jgi:UDP-glucose 4-epimerase
VRPCIVFGPNVDNYLVRLWSNQPFTVDAGHLDGAVQFVHEDDVVDAISRLLLGHHAGQFNLAPDGLMTLRECAELLETPVRKMPVRLYRAIGKALWRLRLSEAPPGQIDFALYPWIVSNEKVKSTLGWTPKHTSRETFEITMRAQGKLPPADPPVPVADVAHASPAAAEPSESPTASRA